MITIPMNRKYPQSKHLIQAQAHRTAFQIFKRILINPVEAIQSIQDKLLGKDSMKKMEMIFFMVKQ